MRNHLFIVAAAIALVAIGFVAGRHVSPVPPSNLRTTTNDSSRSAKIPAETSLAPTLAVAQNPVEVGGEGTNDWARLAALPHSPATDKMAEAALEKMAESDPARALTLALSERNRRRRTDWLYAVLRGWAKVAPGAAAAWLPTLPFNEREGAEGAVMDGAAGNPAGAVALAKSLVLGDPSNARSHANQLLRALSQNGEYEASVGFAAELPEQVRGEMLGTAFQYWAEAQPERALGVALNLPAGEMRKTALDAAISGWAVGDPASLAEFALTLPSTADRTEALQTAMREWVQHDPKTASDWIDKFDPKPEFDAGAAAVALQPDILAKHPDIAASWAESITEPSLRSSTLVNVLREWSGKDAAAALSYAKTSSSLLPVDLTALLNELAARPAAP